MNFEVTSIVSGKDSQITIQLKIIQNTPSRWQIRNGLNWSVGWDHFFQMSWAYIESLWKENGSGWGQNNKTNN